MITGLTFGLKLHVPDDLHPIRRAELDHMSNVGLYCSRWSCLVGTIKCFHVTSPSRLLRKQTGTLHQKRVSRAVTAGLLSPVSTRPLSPSFVAYLALPISAIARWTPTQCPGAQRCHVETCEMAVNSATELFRESSLQQLSVLTSERRVSQASPAKGVVSADKRNGGSH